MAGARPTAWHGSPHMDQEDLSQDARFAPGEAGSTTPNDARPTAAEGSGAASGGPDDVLGRLRALQGQVARLLAEVEDGRVDGVVPGADTRIVIVPATRRRPELPPRRPAAAPATHAPERQSRSGAERRGGSRERRARRDRRRGRRDPRPVTDRVERRAGTADRRSGRGDRRLGHDRRARRAPRAPREHRAGKLLLVSAVELLVVGAGLLALFRGH